MLTFEEAARTFSQQEENNYATSLYGLTGSAVGNETMVTSQDVDALEGKSCNHSTWNLSWSCNFLVVEFSY